MRNSAYISLPSRTQHSFSLLWSVASRHRSALHWERKFYHCLMGVFSFGLYAFFLNRAQALWVLAMVGGVLIFCDVARFWVPAVNAVAMRVFARVMRRDELRHLSGNSFYILGLVTLVVFFPKPVVLRGSPE